MYTCIVYIFTSIHAYVYFTLYYFMCIYYKRLHYSCCDITSFLSSSWLPWQCWVEVELALGIDDLLIKKSGYKLLNCFDLVLPYDLFLQPLSLQV